MIIVKFPATEPQTGPMKLKPHAASPTEVTVMTKFAARLQTAMASKAISRRSKADIVMEKGSRRKFSADTVMPCLSPLSPKKDATSPRTL